MLQACLRYIIGTGLVLGVFRNVVRYQPRGNQRKRYDGDQQYREDRHHKSGSAFIRLIDLCLLLHHLHLIYADDEKVSGAVRGDCMMIVTSTRATELMLATGSAIITLFVS